MRLKLNWLRTSTNATGTLGTAGTANVQGNSGVPAPFPLLPTPGTNGGSGESLFPLFPAVPNDREHEIASVYAPVPIVPAVPAHKHNGEHQLSALDPLVGDPASWESELHQWAAAQCVFRDHAWGGLVALHRDYVDWSHATGNVPPATFSTFRVWIGWQGFAVAGAFVYGVILKEDLEQWEIPPKQSVRTIRAQARGEAS